MRPQKPEATPRVFSFLFHASNLWLFCHISTPLRRGFFLRCVMRAIELDWNEVRHFSRDEFPGDTLLNIDAELILALDTYRHRLGGKVHPSPLTAGWYREGGSSSSRHYAIGRLSDAGDVFPEGCLLNALLTAMGVREFGGIGIYLDTQYDGKPHVMIHADLRPERVYWMRHNGEYIYPAQSAEQMRRFFKLLSDAADAR